jgi:hypothetical protein
MATKQEYYFILKNKDIVDWNTFELPNSDDSVFVNGFLDRQFLSETDLKIKLRI